MTAQPDYQALAADIPDDYPPEQTARHEAAHACAAWALCLPFRFVTIRFAPIPRVEMEPGHRTSNLPLILFHTAGGIADMQSMGWQIPQAGVLQLLYGSPDDTFTLTDAAGRVVRRPERPVAPGQDLHYLTRRIAKTDYPRHEAVALYRDCEKFTASLRPAIDAVAAALLKRGQLDSGQVAKLASAAMTGHTAWIPEWVTLTGDPKADDDALIAEAERQLIVGGLSVEAERQLLAAHDATAGAYPFKCEHEAGHAVALAVLGLPFDRCDVTAPMPCTLLAGRMLEWPSAEADAAAQLVVRAAGGISDLMLRDLALTDEAILQLVRGTAPRYDVTDATGQLVMRPWRLPAVALGRDLHLWSEFTAGWPAPAVVAAYRNVERLIASVLPAVRAVAAELDSRGVLTCGEVRDTTAAAMAGQPRPQIPAWAEEVMSDAMTAMYALSDKAGSPTAADESGNNAAPLAVVPWGIAGNVSNLAFGSPGIIGFAAAGFSTSILNAVKWTPQNSGTTMTGGQVLQGPLPAPIPASGGLTAELWYRFNTANAGPCIAMSLGNQRDTSYLFVWAGTSNWFLGFYKNPSTIPLSAAFVPASTGQMVVTVSGTAAKIYFNGSSSATATLTIPAGFTAANVTLGGPTPATATVAGFGGWDGALSCFSLTPAVLPPARISTRWLAGSVQNQGQNINTLIANTLSYAGIPPAFYNVPATGGVSFADAFDATGQNPLAMLQ